MYRYNRTSDRTIYRDEGANEDRTKLAGGLEDVLMTLLYFPIYWPFYRFLGFYTKFGGLDIVEKNTNSFFKGKVSR